MPANRMFSGPITNLLLSVLRIWMQTISHAKEGKEGFKDFKLCTSLTVFKWKCSSEWFKRAFSLHRAHLNEGKGFWQAVLNEGCPFLIGYTVLQHISFYWKDVLWQSWHEWYCIRHNNCTIEVGNKTNVSKPRWPWWQLYLGDTLHQIRNISLICCLSYHTSVHVETGEFNSKDVI